MNKKATMLVESVKGYSIHDKICITNGDVAVVMDRKFERIMNKSSKSTEYKTHVER